MTNSDQSLKFYKEHKLRAGHTPTPGNTKSGTKCSGGASIPRRLATTATSPISRPGKQNNQQSKSACKEQLYNLHETRRSALVPMISHTCMCKLDHYHNYRNWPPNEIAETPTTPPRLSVVHLGLKTAHTQNIFSRIEPTE